MDRNEGLLIEQAVGTRKPRTGCCRRPRSGPYPFVTTVQAGSSSPLASCQFSLSSEGQTAQERNEHYRAHCLDGWLEKWNGLIDSASSIDNHGKGNTGFAHVEHGTEVCEPATMDERSSRMGDGDSKNEWKIFQRRVKRKVVDPPETDATGSSSRNVGDSGDDLERAASMKRLSHDGSPEYERMQELEKVSNEKSPSQGNLKESYHRTNGMNYSVSGRRRSVSQSHSQKDDGYLSSREGGFRRPVDDVGKRSISGYQYLSRNTDYQRVRGTFEDRDQHGRLKNGQCGRHNVIENGRQPNGRIGHRSGGSKGKDFELEKFPLGNRRCAKVKLKVGGVTQTLLSNKREQSDGEKQFSRGTSSLRNCSNAPGFNKQRQRLILQENSDDEDNGVHISSTEQSSEKDVSLSNIPKVQSNFDLNGLEEECAGGMRTTKSLELPADASQHLLAVRKSSRVPKKRIFDGDGDVELESKRRQRKKAKLVSENGQCCIEEEGNDLLGDFYVDSASEFHGRHKRHCKKKDEQSSDLEGKKELPLSARQRALKCSKEGGDPEPGASLIEFPEGLTHRISKKQRENLSEAEQAIKKEEAARKRRQQSEKHDKETQANAIQKILGQDSSRKKREEKIQKQRKEIEQEKQAAAMSPAINSIRWVMGPSGNVVSFSQDVDLPLIFSGPCSYPQEREKCAAPLCSNTYKYRDSKTRLPLCSLQCYRAIQPPCSDTTF